MKQGAVYQPYLKTLQARLEPTKVKNGAVYQPYHKTLQARQEPTQVEHDTVYHPSLAFASKAKAYPSEAWCSLPALPENISRKARAYPSGGGCSLPP